MGFFKDLREDISLAVNELLPDDSFWGLEGESEEQVAENESEEIGDVLGEMEPIQEGSLGGADNFEAEEQEILAELQKLVSSEVDDEDEKEVTQEEMVSDLESLGLADIARKLTSDVQNDATNSNEENLGVDSFIPEEVAEQEVVKEDKENSLENVLKTTTFSSSNALISL